MSHGAVPNYLALADLLEISIITMNGGDRLPSENELAAQHGVSRVTARAALQELERRHLVRRSKGSGTFVALQLAFTISPDQPPSWSQAVRRAGGEPSVKSVDAVLTRPDPETRERLELGPRDQVVRLRRIGLVNRLVANTTLTCLPADLAPGFGNLVAMGGSLHTILTSLGYRPRREWTRVDMQVPGEEIAAALELEGRPRVWGLTGLVVDGRDGRPLEYGRGWSRPDVFDIHMEYQDKGRAPRGGPTSKEPT
ncbi:GntR family transcriptional regulator [Streptomyces sp. NPDC004752]